MAQRGTEFANSNAPLRVRVDSIPLDEPIVPWYRLLGAARPEPLAVSLHLPSGRADFDVQWPLRLACLSDQPWSVLESIQRDMLWPATKLTRAQRLSRENTKCDVLLHDGPLRTLLAKLLELPYAIRTNLVIACESPFAWGEQESILQSTLGI